MLRPALRDKALDLSLMSLLVLRLKRAWTKIRPVNQKIEVIAHLGNL